MFLLSFVPGTAWKQLFTVHTDMVKSVFLVFVSIERVKIIDRLKKKFWWHVY